MYRETGEDLLGDVRQVLFIVLRKYHGTQAHSMGGEEFFLEAANGQNFAAEGDFAGHRYVAADRNSGKRADDGSANGDAGGRTVLGNGAFRNVDVNIERTVEIFGQTDLPGAGAHVTHGRLRRLLHYVAKFAGEREPAFAFHQRGFGGEDAATHFGPGKTHGQADFVALLNPEFAVFEDAEKIVGVDGGNFSGGFGAGSDDFARHLASDILNFALEAAYAGFMSVMPDDVEQAFVGKLQIIFFESGSLQRALDQEPFGNFQL